MGLGEVFMLLWAAVSTIKIGINQTQTGGVVGPFNSASTIRAATTLKKS